MRSGSEPFRAAGGGGEPLEPHTDEEPWEEAWPRPDDGEQGPDPAGLQANSAKGNRKNNDDVDDDVDIGDDALDDLQQELEKMICHLGGAKFDRNIETFNEYANRWLGNLMDPRHVIPGGTPTEQYAKDLVQLNLKYAQYVNEVLKELPEPSDASLTKLSTEGLKVEQDLRRQAMLLASIWYAADSSLYWKAYKDWSDVEILIAKREHRLPRNEPTQKPSSALPPSSPKKL